MLVYYGYVVCDVLESFPQKGGPPAVTCTARRPAGLAAVAASP